MLARIQKIALIFSEMLCCNPRKAFYLLLELPSEIGERERHSQLTKYNKYSFACLSTEWNSLLAEVSHDSRERMKSLFFSSVTYRHNYVTNTAWSPWQWSFSKRTKWRTTRERKEYWPKFSFILVLWSLLFVFSLLWIGKHLEDRG